MTDVLIHWNGRSQTLRVPTTSRAAAIMRAREQAPGCEIISARARVGMIGAGMGARMSGFDGPLGGREPLQISDV